MLRLTDPGNRISSPPTPMSLVASLAQFHTARCFIPGAKAPKLVINELVSWMKLGSVLLDIGSTRRGCFEDSVLLTAEGRTFEVQ